MDNDVRRSAIVYQAIAETLREQIRDGTYPPGHSFPSIRILAKRFGVGADCIGDALQVLLHEGVVVPDGNSRPVRVPPRVEREIVVLASGSVMSVRMPSPDEREQLHIDPGVGVPVVVISTPGTPDALYPSNRVAVRAAGGKGGA